MMKKSLFGLLAAAAVLPVSGAVVNYSWTGLNGTVVSGQITYTGSGALTEANVTGMTLSVDSVLDNADDLAPTAIDVGGLAIAFNSVTLVQSGSFILFSGDYSLVGTAGSAPWNFTGPSSPTTDDVDGATSLTLTAVPEPEMVAGVAGLGLLAFGAARRRFMKA
jgi:hypothetical protein